MNTRGRRIEAWVRSGVSGYSGHELRYLRVKLQAVRNMEALHLSTRIRSIPALHGNVVRSADLINLKVVAGLSLATTTLLDHRRDHRKSQCLFHHQIAGD